MTEAVRMMNVSLMIDERVYNQILEELSKIQSVSIQWHEDELAMAKSAIRQMRTSAVIIRNLLENRMEWNGD